MEKKIRGFMRLSAKSKLEAKQEFFAMFLLTNKADSFEKQLYDYLGNYDIDTENVFLRSKNTYDVHFTIKAYAYDEYDDEMIRDLKSIIGVNLSVY